MAFEIATCPTTGEECKVLDRLVNTQEGLLRIHRASLPTEWDERVQNDIAALLNLGQESCTYEQCGVSGLTAAMEMLIWADKKARGE
jgi:hypothetical protein